MKRARFRSRLVGAKVALLLATASHAQPSLAPGPHFKPAVMASRIEATMRPQVVGFAYTIAKDGVVVREDGDGRARIAVDGLRAHGPQQRQNVASVTKWFTAVAILKLIEANRSRGVTPDTAIGAYLPDGWAAGPNVANLTFAEVMRHRTGFSSGNINSLARLGYEGVRTLVANGTTPRPPGGGERGRAYDNVNFALLRELMPKLFAQANGVPIIPFGSQQSLAARFYPAYLSQVLAPIGIQPVRCSDSQSGTLYYPLNPVSPGVLPQDQSDFCGSGGLYVSTNDMARFLVYLFRTEQLLPASARQAMINRGFGISPVSTNTSRGLAYSHGGSVGVGQNADGRAGVKACMMQFPDGVVAALVQNSPDNANIAPCTVLLNAYEAAWN